MKQWNSVYYGFTKSPKTLQSEVSENWPFQTGIFNFCFILFYIVNLKSVIMNIRLGVCAKYWPNSRNFIAVISEILLMKKETFHFVPVSHFVQCYSICYSTKDLLDWIALSIKLLRGKKIFGFLRFYKLSL